MTTPGADSEASAADPTAPTAHPEANRPWRRGLLDAWAPLLAVITHVTVAWIGAWVMDKYRLGYGQDDWGYLFFALIGTVVVASWPLLATFTLAVIGTLHVHGRRGWAIASATVSALYGTVVLLYLAATAGATVNHEERTFVLILGLGTAVTLLPLPWMFLRRPRT